VSPELNRLRDAAREVMQVMGGKCDPVMVELRAAVEATNPVNAIADIAEECARIVEATGPRGHNPGWTGAQEAIACRIRTQLGRDCPRGK
jgi:hypothetical protein